MRLHLAVLLACIAAVCVAVVLGYNAASNEITGRAVYHEWTASAGKGGGRLTSLPVTRVDSPKRFRGATNHLWAGAIVFCTAGAGLFFLYRKLDYETDL